MMVELKKCPFCGGEARLSIKEDGRWGRVWYVRCSKCYARTDGYREPAELSECVNPYKKITETVDNAVELWNKRADNGNDDN